MAAEGYEEGLGFLPGVAVDQHFFARARTKDMTALIQLYPQLLGIGIDERTALWVEGTKAEVLGKGNVGFFDANFKLESAHAKDYILVKPGESFDLKTRKIISK